MASGGSRNSNSDQVPYLEEWKAKRERMRLKSSSSGSGLPLTENINLQSKDPNPKGKENLHDSSASAPWTPSSNTASQNRAVAFKQSESNVTSGEKDKREMLHKPTLSEGAGCSEEGSPSPKSREKKGGGAASHRKNKTQIEKRKLREKRRSTGVVNLPFNSEFLDEGDDSMNKEEQAVTTDFGQVNTQKKESQDGVAAPYNRQKSRTGSTEFGTHTSLSRSHSSGQPKHTSYHDKDNAYNKVNLEKRMDELQKAVTGEKQENQRLKTQLQERDGVIQKLQSEISVLNKDLTDLEGENQLLREENKTLLRVVGQLTS
ncbi:PRKC apoptosis WT1 regulator protein isoform X2 [Latimeria chalumnae]|nr:PREDICTED: PRKC apoptosis WT1 regulator protein-like [Latimeria chalumnae]XP_014349760.1 PREDICTED: PRKC apoptosis WT1 regulator protein-like [Latimeria chalumnae]|eukprot:XP_005988052.1 PREDICTED: PRKC apoptosis WT1 regulator protein-like [Latimeria chalumnae]